MPKHQPSPASVEISEVRDRLDALIERVSNEEARVVMTKSGVPVAVLVPAAELSRLDSFARQRAERFKVIDEVRAAFAGVPDEEIERETDRILGINQEAPRPVSRART
ncbi:MAG: type II toxin-antitoxin system Phd/YefM family antitoxin [Chloroflexota bacterium]|nr:type II toxin-antitoxin system Phd/YefM family antitoxin [Chloroflexota bacterium]